MLPRFPNLLLALFSGFQLFSQLNGMCPCVPLGKKNVESSCFLPYKSDLL